MRGALLIRRSLILAVAGMIVLWGAVIVGINYAVNHSVSANAEQKAQQWAKFFIEEMPNLNQLIATGRPDPIQLERVTSAAKIGDVFRFKLFDRQGHLTLVSDEVAYASEGATAREQSDKAAQVLKTGNSNVSLKDGTGKKNRPPLYVEAFVPIVDGHGGVRGVVEIYIDQTQMASLLKSSFAKLSMGLAFFAALTFGFPMMAYLLRSKQASEARQQVDYLARYEPLTGLLNRASFTEELDAILREGERGKSLALVLLDVDDFKAINDSHGHEAGDEFLKHVAACITGLCRETDVASRPGGDEFILALTSRSESDIVALVEQLMRDTAEPIVRENKSISGKLSIGIYLVDRQTDTMADALHKADVALYQAKADGRNTYRLFTEDMETGMRARRALEQLIGRATAQNGFELHYQPLLHAESGACAGFEALLRLPDGKGGYVSPLTCIPVIEAMGLINAVGKWVIEEATRTAATWPSHLFVSVNLSVKQFEDGTLAGHVKRALDSSGLRPKQLELEVTETLLMQNTESTARQLAELRELGVALSMDDFGTGYSSLGYLWQFRFDKLKIDRSFISALCHNEKKAVEILDTIIMLGHKLDMTVTAEGIETAHQAEILVSLSCDHVQGYLYGPPAQASEIALFLLENTRTRLAPKKPVAKIEARPAVA